MVGVAAVEPEADMDGVCVSVGVLVAELVAVTVVVGVMDAVGRDICIVRMTLLPTSATRAMSPESAIA